jgi:hypothetical protein
MIVVSLLVGIVSGVASAAAAWSFGLGLPLSVLAYPAGGMAGMLAAGLIGALPGALLRGRGGAAPVLGRVPGE